jgi:hypothetical protein
MRCAGLLAAVALLAGCGAHRSEPRLPRALATAWRHQADSIADALAAGDRCVARRQAVALQRAVIAAVNGGRLTAEFQEPLVSGVNELASRIRCAE